MTRLLPRRRLRKRLKDQFFQSPNMIFGLLLSIDTYGWKRLDRVLTRGIAEIIILEAIRR